MQDEKIIGNMMRIVTAKLVRKLLKQCTEKIPVASTEVLHWKWAEEDVLDGLGRIDKEGLEWTRGRRCRRGRVPIGHPCL